MCGIVGAVGHPKSGGELLLKMMDTLVHRGPDAEGQFVDAERGVYLGSRRLSIIDLSDRGRMPMLNESSAVAVCQNGEIYNYLPLRRELESLGHTFRSDSDTEAIVHGYEEWGTAVFGKLRGMFAIVIYDKSCNKVLLARDRVGIKPLYYLHRSGTIYFSSEVKAFTKLEGPSLSSDLDFDNVNLLLGLMFLPKSDETIIKGVKKLEAGYFMSISTTTLETTLTKYWDLPEVSNAPDGRILEDCVEALDGMLAGVVRQHLASDVPLGVLLSGGLDSSLISYYVKAAAGTEVLTFSAKFDHEFDESENARDVASYVGTTHNEILIDTKEIMRDLESYIWYFDDLTTFDGGLFTTKLLSHELKKRGITVVLLGEGADEVFGGYSWFGLSQLPFSLLPAAVRAGIYYYAISRNITFKPWYYYKEWYHKSLDFRTGDIFRDISSLELKVQLPNHLLMKVDKGSMAASVEARVPYLDHEVVEYVYRLPRKFKLNKNVQSMKESNEKYILREVAKRHLPQEVACRKKRGFMMPMRDVLMQDIGKVRDYILCSDSLSRIVLPKRTLAGLFDLDGPPLLNMQKEYLLWRLLLLEVWKKEYGKKRS